MPSILGPGRSCSGLFRSLRLWSMSRLSPHQSATWSGLACAEIGPYGTPASRFPPPILVSIPSGQPERNCVPALWMFFNVDTTIVGARHSRTTTFLTFQRFRGYVLFFLPSCFAVHTSSFGAQHPVQLVSHIYRRSKSFELYCPCTLTSFSCTDTSGSRHHDCLINQPTACREIDLPSAMTFPETRHGSIVCLVRRGSGMALCRH